MKPQEQYAQLTLLELNHQIEMAQNQQVFIKMLLKDLRKELSKRGPK